MRAARDVSARRESATRRELPNAREAPVNDHPVVPLAVTVPAPPSVSSRDDEDVPRGLRVAAAWSWRLLVLATAAAVTFWLIGRLKDVLIPLSIALLLSALLAP